MSEFELLKTIKEPSDIKQMPFERLQELCQEIRAAIINRVSKGGGHLGPNLGIVETAVALHYVFDSPKDKIIWDVSHQCYPHKMLTGRAQGFYDDTFFKNISGFTAPEESKHDIFTIGHTSTSVSLAYGLAKARDYQNEKENIIAVIGDGSLSGGEAFEGLDNAGDLKTNFIVVINDNEMSIAENHGGLYGNLQELRKSKGQYADNYFKTLGFDYTYVEDGNDLKTMIETFKKIKDINHPIVVHVHTLKGKGYRPAEQEKEKFHWCQPFDVKSGKILGTTTTEDYGCYIAQYLENRVKTDPKLVVINAATPTALHLKEFRADHPERYIDVGIAEEHAIATASGLAKGGMRPVALFFGGFIQRAYDQLSQDLSMNKSPAVIIIEGTGISGGDITHLGIFDIALMSNIPGLVCLAPSTKDEALRMLDWALEQRDFPVVIRTPWKAPESLKYAPTSPIKLNKSEITHKGEKIAILGLGSFLSLAEKTAELLKTKGIDATIVDPRFTSTVDIELLHGLTKDHNKFIVLEDGCVAGGYGSKVASLLSPYGVKVYSFGASREFTNRVPLKDLYERYNLTPEQIVQKVL